MKTAAALLLIFSTTATGISYSTRIKRKIEICNELIRFCDMLMLDIEFRNTPLTELIESFDFKYLEFLKIESIKNSGNISFPFSENENEKLSSYLYQLGKTDVKGQIKIIEGLKEYVKSLLKKYSARYEKNAKLYISLGFFGGAVLSLMII